MHRLTLATIFAAALAAPAAAQEFDAGGTATGPNNSVVNVIADGHVVIMVMIDYEGYEPVDPDSPVAGLTGPCFGMVEVRDTATEGGGYCTFDDADGDRSVVRWDAEEAGANGELGGSWTLIGGSGKWVGGSGSGTFAMTTDADTGRFTSLSTGTVTLP